MKKLSQAKLVRAALEAGKSLTPMDAYANYGCLRLAAIIHKLRLRGMDIETKIPEGEHYAVYTLKQ